MRQTLFGFRGLALLSGAVAFLACAVPDEAPPEIASESASPGYEDLMARARIPGLAVAVIEDGQVARTDLLGVSSAETGEPVTEETLFEAASMSKPVFATAVLRMAERGELDLDQPLHQMLPYERISHDPRSEALTARLVLSHRTGLPNWGPETLEFINDPGGKFGYSGEGYVYLQRALEATTDLTLDELVRREVFDPLGMTRSRFSWTEGEELPLAMPHDQAGEAQAKRPAHEGNAAASLHTTAEEYGLFVAAWLSGELLSGSTTDEALTPVSYMQGGEQGVEEERVWRRIAWGLGWGVQLDARKGAEPDTDEAVDPLYWHWGDNGPFKAFVAFRPATGDGIVYFANAMHGLAIAPALVNPVVGNMDPAFDWCGYERVDAPGFVERLDGAIAEGEGRFEEAIAAYRAALEVDPGNEITERQIAWLGELVEVAESPVEVSEENLERYTGTYGPRVLELEDGALHYQRDGGRRFRLIPLSDTLFAFEGLTLFRLEVALDAAGQPTKLIGHYVQGNTDESPRDP